jgi:hypothetical protein
MSLPDGPNTFLKKVSEALVGHRLEEACADLRQMALTDADAIVLLGVMTEHCSTLCAVERGRVFRLIKTRVNAMGFPALADVSALPAPALGASASAAPQQQQQQVHWEGLGGIMALSCIVFRLWFVFEWRPPLLSPAF